METLIFATAYILITLVAYAIILYYNDNEDEVVLIMASLIWPILLITAIGYGPFYLVKKAIRKIKMIKNSKTLDLSITF